MPEKAPEKDTRGPVRQKLNRLDKLITWFIIAVFALILAFMFTFYAFR